jgi:hypothetical protein
MTKTKIPKPNWINYRKPEGLKYQPENEFDVLSILSCSFKLEGCWNKIGYLRAQIGVKANGLNFIETPINGQIFEPNIWEFDHVKKEITKAKHELHEIAAAIEKIENGKAETVEIQIKFNKGKKSKETIIITHPEILPRIFELLKTLPEGEQKPTPKKGNIEKQQYKQFIFESIGKCFELIESIDPDLNETDKLFFSGLILTLAGVIEPPRLFYEGFTTDPDQVKDYRDKLTDSLKYYKSTGK